jgi:chitodextrinase
MESRRMRRLIAATIAVALGAALLAPATSAMATPTCTTTPRIGGSFVQPALIDGMTSTQLTSEFSTLTNACITSQVLQWTADTGNDTTVYPSGLAGYTQSTSTDVVSRLLTAADTAGVKEYLGLGTDNDWWTNYANNTTWLSSQATAADALADDLYSKYSSHTSLSGWYIPFEVDNWNFLTSTTWSNMATFLSTVATHLHTLSPGLPVIIAPFFNTSGGQTSSQWTTMWESILANAPIDVLALQDGVGDGHATTAQLSTWFSATQTAITTSSPSTALWSDSDTYNPDFTPMSISNVVADLDAEAPYVSNILSFSYDHYDSPSQVPSAYDATYRGYLANGSVETTAPTTPTSPSATNAGVTAIDLSWTASTDNVGVAGYLIYRGGVLVKTTEGTGTTFDDVGLSAGTNYTYKIAAFDGAGNTSAQTSSVNATTSAAPSPVPTLLSSSKSYTATLAADASYPDTSGTELTNGTTGTAVYTDSAWQGRNTGSPYSFTVDLGATHTVKQVSIDFLQYQSVAIYLPSQIAVSTSTNGTTFTSLVTLPKPALSTANQSYTYIAYSLSASARYVKFTVTPASSAWSFTDELTVRGT